MIPEEIADQYPQFSKCPDLVFAPPDRKEILKEWGGSGFTVDQQVLERCMEMIDHTITRGAQYWMMRFNGSSDSFAAMIALQQGPGINTDDTFFHGSKPLYDQFGSQQHLDRYLKAAKRRGFTPSVNSTYFPSLARFAGDPEAFVTRAQGRGYIRKLCEKRGWACEGAVKVDHREPESDPLAPEKCTPLGEDIISNRASEMMNKNPDLRFMNRKDLREQIIDKHGPSTP